jgi:hypothetical protein
MTAAYLLARKEPIENPILGKGYRIVGRIFVNGAIYVPIKIEDNFVHFKGYVKPIERKSILFFEVK